MLTYLLYLETFLLVVRALCKAVVHGCSLPCVLFAGPPPPFLLHAHHRGYIKNTQAYSRLVKNSPGLHSVASSLQCFGKWSICKTQMHTKFADDTKLRAVDFLKGGDTLQRDLDKLRGWAITKFNKNKLKLGGQNSRYTLSLIHI